MSAFMVNNDHIDAMLTAGLSWNRYGAIHWHWPRITIEEHAEATQPGAMLTQESIDLCKARSNELTEATAGRVGAMLLAQNRRSVDYRYAEEEIEEPYVFRRLAGVPKPLVVLKAIACYEYQACETPDWPETEAHEFCQRLRIAAINALPGYDDAEGWEVRRREVFLSLPKCDRCGKTVNVMGIDNEGKHHPGNGCKKPDARGSIDRNDAIGRIKMLLKARSGKEWSVTGDRGTAWGWINITAPPKRRTNNWAGGPRGPGVASSDCCYMTAEDAKELGELLGLGKPACLQGVSIADSSDHRWEYIDRAGGKTPEKCGQQYWD